MALLNKIDSNATGLRYAEEASIGVLPATPQWNPLEPNSYSDFGGQITTLARNPINPSRQRKKGVVTDLDAAGAFNNDLTQENLQDVLQGVFFADLRRKAESDVVLVDGAAEEFDLTNRRVATAVVGTSGGAGYAVGDVVTVAGGVNTIPATVTVTSVSTGAILTADITEPGAYSTEPALIDNGVTGGSGAGGQITITMSDISTYAAGDLIFAKNFTNAINNGLHSVTGITAGLNLAVGTNLVAETPGSIAEVVKIGLQGAAGDLDIDVAGSLPALTSTILDFTTLGLIPGEPIFIGGDTAATAFANATNNGFARVRSVAANRVEFDKTQFVMVAEASTTETVRLFLGRVLKNELGALIKRRTYNLERTLGAPDDSNLAAVQAEYLEGSIPNETTFNMPTADKLNVDISWVATKAATRTASQGLKAGTRPALIEADAFNTSSDFSRIKISKVVPGDAAPVPLFAFVQELTFTINNNVSPNKALGVLGAFEVTSGTFEVNAKTTAYFSNVEAVASVQNNDDVTIDVAIVKANAGIFIDLPLVSLGDGRPNVEQDQPITLPLSMDAATAAKIDPTLDYTAMMTFFDYLPTLADL